jgi:hypothetical protein
MRAGGMLDALPEEDVIYTIRTVVGRDGRIANYELLLADGERLSDERRAVHIGHQQAVLDAVQQSRFAPAQTPLGQAVAVDMVWVIAKTTAVVEPEATAVPAVAAPGRTKAGEKPALPEPAAPVNQRSAAFRRSTTA